jgi:ABC-type molybdate transport system substrate-binding protein
MVISLLSCFLLRSAEGEDLVLYGAGSLREVMTQIASDYQAVRGTHVRTDFGPSGLMRERIQRGEKVDVFASADLGHPPAAPAGGARHYRGNIYAKHVVRRRTAASGTDLRELPR